MRIQAFLFVLWPVTIYFICLSVICNENFIQPQWTRNVLSLHILKSKKLLLLGNWSNTKKMSEILSRWAMFMWRGKVHTLGTLIIVIPLVPFLAQHLWHMFLILSLQSRKFYLCTSVFRVGPFYPGGSAQWHELAQCTETLYGLARLGNVVSIFKLQDSFCHGFNNVHILYSFVPVQNTQSIMEQEWMVQGR